MGQLPGEAEVGDFDVGFGADQAVSGGQVPVYVVVPLQVGHALTHLPAATCSSVQGQAVSSPPQSTHGQPTHNMPQQITSWTEARSKLNRPLSNTFVK